LINKPTNTEGRTAAANSKFAIGGVSCSVSAERRWLQKVQFSERTFVLKSTPIANLQTVTHNAKTDKQLLDILMATKKQNQRQ
jgi:hypothetical protein